MMHLIAFLIAALVTMGAAFGQDAAPVGNSGSGSVATDYRQVMRACGAEWKASDTRKGVAKGEGMAAWQTFRRDCVARSGYVSKRNRTANTQ
jgi:hypothetical protein